MAPEYFLFIDSGIGGISTLAQTNITCHANFIYFADNKHCPYGSHSNDEIFDFIQKIILNLKRNYNFHTVVLACNTATTAAILKLRTTFPDLNFIGTEPAINLAFKLGYKKVLSLTTPTTAKQIKYLSLIQERNVKTVSMKNFAKNIENYFYDECYYNYFALLKNIFSILGYLQKNNFDCVVLGCTHYCLIKNIFSKFLNIAVIDGNCGVARRISDFSQKQSNVMSNIVFKFSCQKKHLTQKYKKCYNKYLQNI